LPYREAQDSLETRPKKSNCGLYDLVMRVFREHPGQAIHDRLVCGKELAGASETLTAESTADEEACRQKNGLRIAVGITRDLTQHPIDSASVCQNYSWAEFRGRQVRERESDKDH
jgi:hypothetical protein